MARKKRKKRPIIYTLSKKADKALSEFVRAQTKWTYSICPLCKQRPIECCFHFISRRRKILRWEIKNVIGACFTCNYIERIWPDLSRAWYIKTYGVDRYLQLVEESKKTFEPTAEYLEGIITKYKADLKLIGDTI